MRWLRVSSTMVVAVLALAGVGSASIGPASLCKPLTPPRAHLPAWLKVGMSNYTYRLTSNARAHSGLCSIGLASPSDGYTYDVDLEAFPTHARAVADFGGLDLAAAYRQVISKTAVQGFPAPSFELTGIGLDSGKPVGDVTFVDGDALVSAYIYGPGTLRHAVVLGRWVASDLKAVARG